MNTFFYSKKKYLHLKCGICSDIASHIKRYMFILCLWFMTIVCRWFTVITGVAVDEIFQIRIVVYRQELNEGDDEIGYIVAVTEAN